MELKSEKEIQSLRLAGRFAAQLLDAVCAQAKAGLTTGDLDSFAAKWIKEHGAAPAFLNYRGFPKTICISVNDEVVHGIPGSRKIREGDLLGIDVGLFYEGWCGDTARTICIGEVSPQQKRLLEVSKRSLEYAISQAVVGNRLGDVSFAMQNVVESAGYSVVRQYGGHGIGRALHEDPHIPCLGQRGTGTRLKSGMVLALEVMVNAGSPDVLHRPDGWTVYTEDGAPSAHFEHMVALRESGTEILTIL